MTTTSDKKNIVFGNYTVQSQSPTRHIATGDMIYGALCLFIIYLWRFNACAAGPSYSVAISFVVASVLLKWELSPFGHSHSNAVALTPRGRCRYDFGAFWEIEKDAIKQTVVCGRWGKRCRGADFDRRLPWTLPASGCLARREHLEVLTLLQNPQVISPINSPDFYHSLRISALTHSTKTKRKEKKPILHFR